jgi:hypothetical protein
MGVYQVAVDQAIEGSPHPVVNVFHVDKAEQLFVSAAATTIRDAWIAEFSQGQCSVIRTERIRLQQVDGLEYFEIAVGEAGANTDPAVTPQVALMLRKVAPGIARKRYGRMYVAGITEDAFDGGGNVTQTAMNDWTTRGSDFLAALVAGSCPMVQPSWTGTSGGPSFTSAAEVTSLVPASRVSTQKRRVSG